MLEFPKVSPSATCLGLSADDNCIRQPFDGYDMCGVCMEHVGKWLDAHYDNPLSDTDRLPVSLLTSVCSTKVPAIEELMLTRSNMAEESVMALSESPELDARYPRSAFANDM